MKRDSVTYRLGTSGERDVLDTLAKIAAGGDQSAKRLASSYDRELRTADAAFDRLTRKAEALKVLGGSAVQRSIAESTGLAAGELGNTKSAEASMGAFIRQQDELARSRERLIQQADPLAAAQMRYNATMAEAVRLDRAGALAAGELGRIHATARSEVNALGGAHQQAEKMVGSLRFGIQNLGFQASDFAVQIAGGTSATRAFALQAPQAVQALAMMGAGADGSKSKFAAFTAFLAGPWGAALTVGVSILGAFLASMERSGKASDDLSDKLDFQKMSHDQLAKAIKDQREQAEKSILTSYEQAEAARALAEQNLNAALSERKKLAAELDRRKEALAWAENPLNPENTGGTAAASGAGRALGDLRGAQAAVTANDRDIRDLEKTLRAREVPIARRQIEAGNDPVARAKLDAEMAEARIVQQYRDGKLTREKFAQELDRIADAENKAVESARKMRQVREMPAGAAANLGDMRALIEKIFPGVAITSTTGGKHTKGSDHYAGRAIDFVVPGMMNPAGTAMVEQMLRGAGIDIRRNARGTEQFFGPGRSANRPGDHNDHFHVAWQGKADPVAFEKNLAEERERNLATVRQLVEAGDPFAGIANQLKDDLAEIDRLAAVRPGQGGLGSEQADILRQQARERASTAKFDLFFEQNPGYGDALDEADRQHAEEAERRRDFIAQTLADQERANVLLDAELGLVRATADERGRELRRLEMIEDIKERAPGITQEEIAAILRGNDALLEKEGLLRRQSQLWEEQRRIGENIIDTVLDPSAWDDWGELGKKVIADLIREMLILAAINPLKNALFGSGLPTVGSGGIGGFLAGILGGGPKIDGSGGVGGAIVNISSAFRGNASGTEWSDGGWRRVGEFGEELVRLPRGSQVTNAGRTRAMDRASARPVPANITINAPGADAAALARVEVAVRELNDSIEGRAIGAVADANSRTFGALLTSY